MNRSCSLIVVLFLWCASPLSIVAQCDSAQTVNSVFKDVHKKGKKSAIRTSAQMCYRVWSACYREKDPSVGSVDFVRCNYNMAYYAFLLQRYDLARTHVQNCMMSPAAKSTPFNQSRTYHDVASRLSTSLASAQRSEASALSLTYSGKQDFYFDIETTDTASAHTPEQIDSLQRRLLPVERISEFRAIARSIGKFDTVLFAPPFVICMNSVEGGGAWYSDELSNEPIRSGVRASKKGIATAIKEIRAKIPFITKEFETMFGCAITHTDVAPVYVTYSGYGRNGYVFFAETAKTISLASAGQRFGMFNEYDNSILYWYPSGIGTFAHELVHLLISIDNADLPDWLDEGISSMAETGSLNAPLDNWRLIYIQTDVRIRNQRLGLRTIVADTTPTGYHKLLIPSYWRYFVMFLKERGVLGKVYSTIKQQVAEPFEVSSFGAEQQLEIVRSSLGMRSIEEVEMAFHRFLDQRYFGSNNRYNHEQYRRLVWDALNGPSRGVPFDPNR